MEQKRKKKKTNGKVRKIGGKSGGKVEQKWNRSGRNEEN